MTRRLLAGLLSVCLLAALTWSVGSLPVAPKGLTAVSLASLAESGVTNPVTAVLLSFRGYDTLLEIGVLLLAITGVWSLRRADWPKIDRRDFPVLSPFLSFILPLLVLSAGYLLWIGAFAPGGAFQGGALLGGALVLAVLGGRGRQLLNHRGLLATGLVLGLLVFVAASALSMLLTGGMLQYPPGQGGVWILAIESAALISIGLTLGLLYVGGRPIEEETPTP